MSLEKVFQPDAFEPRIGKLWQSSGAFAADPSRSVERFCLVIPPPNVTGALHIGHALDYTLQDVLIRRHRMLGRDTLWVPGSDHAGIATQMVVERRLREQGTSRHELGREKFVEKAYEWKEEYHARIVSTLNRLGCSCDWSRERFTMDAGFSRAVREAFVRWYEEKLIYRGRRMINWCPDCRTALSDLEVNRDDPEPSELWSFAYPVAGRDEEIVVATTRPETMLGDTAVAVHPDDQRWKHLIGERVAHPFFPERAIPIVGDPILADPETGTGAVKVTPSHDPNDFECGLRHDLEQINLMTESAQMNESAGPYAGLDRFEARKRVKADLEALGLARGAKPHSYALGRCQRCRTVVEPMVSTQWFCSMEPLAKPALEAVRSGEIRFVPENWAKTYFHWLENIQDWCISRQLWWGHRIPAWYCQDCDEVIVARDDPDACTKCGGSSLEQDQDVLDTWFSSQLWPFGVHGWPEKTEALARYYPTDVLVTGFDIIFFWVARMIMSGLHLTGKAPFHTVLYHGLVRDGQGKKMSKSGGNAVEPETAIAEHGVDAVRFTLSALASPGSDLALSEERLVGYRAFMNKLWNATRFLLMRTPEQGDKRVDYTVDELDDIDRFLLASYARTVAEVDAAYREYRFDHVCQKVYHFLWNTYCDWSIELAKGDLIDESTDAAQGRRAAVRRAVLFDVLDGALRLLHPISPFITEELWQHLPRRAGDPDLLTVARMPTPDDLALGLDVPADWSEIQDRLERWLISPVSIARALRTGAGIAPGKKVDLRLKARRPEGREHLERFAERIGALANAKVEVRDELDENEPALRDVSDSVEATIPMAGVIDLDQERKRLGGDRAKLEKELTSRQRKLGNESFVAKAPAEVVDKERARVAELESRLAEVDRLLAQLG